MNEPEENRFLKQTSSFNNSFLYNQHVRDALKLTKIINVINNKNIPEVKYSLKAKQDILIKNRNIFFNEKKYKRESLFLKN